MASRNRTSARPHGILLFLLAFSITLFLANAVNTAFAQVVDPVVARPDFRGLLAILLPILAFYVTGPLTALIKNASGSEGAATEIVNVLVNGIIKGATAYLAGEITGVGLEWLAYAIAFAVVGVLKDRGDYRRQIQTTTRGVEKAEPVATSPVARAGADSNTTARGNTRLD